MSPRSQAPAPLDSPSYWRKLMAVTHPDRGHGDHELFVFLTALREQVEGCSRHREDGLEPAHHRYHDRARVPYDEALGFVDEHIMLTHRALSIAETVEEPFCGVLRLLVDYDDNVEHGGRALRQCRGATWCQVSYIAHLANMSKAERQRWYELCRSIPLSEALASHLINRLKDLGINLLTSPRRGCLLRWAEGARGEGVVVG